MWIFAHFIVQSNLFCMIVPVVLVSIKMTSSHIDFYFPNKYFLHTLWKFYFPCFLSIDFQYCWLFTSPCLWNQVTFKNLLYFFFAVIVCVPFNSLLAKTTLSHWASQMPLGKFLSALQYLHFMQEIYFNFSYRDIPNSTEVNYFMYIFFEILLDFFKS